jgi:hypothetical protein
MKTKTIAAVGLVVVIGCVVASVVIKRQARPESVGRKTERETQPAPVAEVTPISNSAPQVELIQPDTQANVETQKLAPASTNQARAGQPKEIADPLARVALSLVGVDPDAEQYWLEAIYDPSLSDQEREDLMEDLNEEGLSDPRNPGLQDLPVILNRLAIIEEVAPYADEFMLPHIWEAYKDLGDLLDGKSPR